MSPASILTKGLNGCRSRFPTGARRASRRSPTARDSAGHLPGVRTRVGTGARFSRGAPTLASFPLPPRERSCPRSSTSCRRPNGTSARPTASTACDSAVTSRCARSSPIPATRRAGPSPSRGRAYTRSPSGRSTPVSSSRLTSASTSSASEFCSSTSVSSTSTAAWSAPLRGRSWPSGVAYAQRCLRCLRRHQLGVLRAGLRGRSRPGDISGTAARPHAPP